MFAISSLKGLSGELKINAPLAEYTSWRVGGIADCLYIPNDLNDLSLFVKQIPKDVPILWLGLGSNVLIRDGGIEGVVIVTQGALNKMLVEATNIRAEAGVACAQLARSSARSSLKGLEFMAGIPGTVGGALRMNAGCFGGETWKQVTAVEMMNRSGDINRYPASQFEVGYRHVTLPEDEWFVAGHFALQAGDKETSLSEIRTLLEKRNTTQPTGLPNCGSVFRNPPGHFAARLIEQCGLKGKKIGGAYVSEKHANFIINDGHATAADIEQLIYAIKESVEQKESVRLILEVCIMGRFAD